MSEEPAGGSVPVIAAVVERGGRYLVAKRPVQKRHGGLWEFPGGKLKEGEGMLEAARRELREELALEAVAIEGEELAVRDPGSPFRIVFARVRVRGEPRALEHAEVAWRSPRELEAMALCPADARFVRERLAPGVSPEARRAPGEG